MSRKIVSLFLAAVMMAACLSAMAGEAALTVTDMHGREISLPEAATRVVALQPSDCEILCALGCEEALVGVGAYCDYPASIASLPVVQSGNETNIEEILALNPQVVFLNDMAQSEEQVNQLEENGVRVVVSKATDIEELQARCDIANAKEADIFISIHMDSFTSNAAKGTTGYYYAMGSQKSKDLADKVRQGVIDQLGTSSRGTQSCSFYVVKHTDMPATLVELAFVSNKAEEKLLYSSEGVKKAAQGILDGIEDYFN